ncbi:hypothetical protein BDF19DRAFT_416275 [Syncephalis fuscata]|nr:hypothetical protein BDF19DRAFT_416275 [Syncephalis fuscata]
MSTQNNDILPRIWLVIDIIHYISQFSELSATVALARTCKLLYNSIIGCDNLWRRMYQQHFPRDIDTDIDWLQWQLKQEPRITEAATDMENRATSKVTWFQRYRQRASMGLNWQNNKPTSTFYIESTTVDKLLKSGIGRSMMTVSYPGWIAIANRYNPFVDLIKLSTNNIAKNYLLKLDENRLKFIKNIAFYQCQQQVDAIDEGMRVIVCLEYFEGLFDVLQVWDANSCQLLHFIDINGKWDGRIIGASLLVSSSQRIAPSNTLQSTYYTRLIYNIGSTTQLHEPPSIIFPNIDYSYKYRIHSTSNNETIFVQYCKSEFRLDYKIIRVQLTPDTNLEIIGDDTMRMATIASDYITVSNLTKLWVSEFYSIDRDRILVHCNAHLPEGTSNVNIDNYQRYIE